MEMKHEEIIGAAARLLESRGCEIIDRGWLTPGVADGIDLVVVDDGALAFVDVAARRGTDGFPARSAGRETSEILAAKWLAECGEGYTDMPIRFDAVSMMVLGNGRAMVRWHRDCLGAMEPCA